MILRALYDLAQQEGLAEDLDFEPVQLRYTLVLGPNGMSATVQDRGTLVPAEGKKKSELRKPTIFVPRRSGRTSGDSAEFLVDKSDYVLGWDPSGKTAPDKALRRQALYRDRIVEALTSQAPGSQEAQALQALLDFTAQDLDVRTRSLQEALAKCPSEKEKKELESAFFSVEYAPIGPTPIHLLPGVRDYWKASRIENQKAEVQCLVTGQLCVPVDKHPQLKNVPGGNTSGASLISFNSPAFLSYALDNNANAPIGREASEAIASALNRLLSRNPAKADGTPTARRHVRLSSDTVALFWADKASNVDWFEQFTEDPDAVEATLLAPLTGRKSVLEDPASFHTLILSGAQGRSVVRAYGCRTTAAVAQEVQRYLDQVRVQRPFNKGEGAYPLRTYLRSLAALGDEKNLPPQLAGALYMAILEGTPFPRMVLDAALRRARLEASRMSDADPRRKAEAVEAFAARCGLIRAYFHRHSPNPKEISVNLDTECLDPGYLCGRIFAVLVKIQEDSAEVKLNRTIADSYYSAACSTPGLILPNLLSRTQHHLSKLRRDPKKVGWAVKHDQRLDEILGMIKTSSAFPKTLGTEQQGLFTLGFYHQRQAFFS